jgi:hypothetical protein
MISGRVQSSAQVRAGDCSGLKTEMGFGGVNLSSEIIMVASRINASKFKAGRMPVRASEIEIRRSGTVVIRLVYLEGQGCTTLVNTLSRNQVMSRWRPRFMPRRRYAITWCYHILKGRLSL